MLEKKKWVHRDQTYKYFDHDAEGIGFLSSLQGEIVRNSKQFKESDYLYELDFLEDNPFLVATILKESEKE